MNHLNVRVAWHDSRWDGTVCRQPCANSFCVDLDRIREERNDQLEQANAGANLAVLPPDKHPACKAESGAFMNARPWVRQFNHPYQSLAKTQATHGQLKPTLVKVEPYTTFVVPFAWMSRDRQNSIDESLATTLPPDSEPPFPSAWVFSKERQEALSEVFFGRIQPGNSLVFFYTKSGQPIGDAINRLVVGVGSIDKLSGLLRYDSSSTSTYPLWDRKLTHSIRPEGHEGLLLPYHDYLEPTGDAQEDARRRDLLAEIAVVPESGHLAAFSFAGELSTSDVALSALLKCLDAVQKIRSHGIVKGSWDKREEWLNAKIATTWKERGSFPGVGSALEALGMRLGTSLVLHMFSAGLLQFTDDPWKAIDKLFRDGAKTLPQFSPDLNAIAPIWAGLSDERRALLKLLSRFDLTPQQAKRWFDPTLRARATRATVSEISILANPYRIAETDLGDFDSSPISLGVLDRGLRPDSTVRANHPVPAPSAVESSQDLRRLRAGYVTILRNAAANGDSLLSLVETSALLSKLNLAEPCLAPADWLSADPRFVHEEITRLEIPNQDPHRPPISALQLVELRTREDRLSKILGARTAATLPSLQQDWRKLLELAIVENGGSLENSNGRHHAALEEQASALERLTTRKLSVLVGRAGTGKTTVLGALLKCLELQRDGVLFLAPTGKARVRLAQKANTTAMTIAQFLHQLGRYDGQRQRPLFEGKGQYRKEKTVVVDESSMLTSDDLFAILMSLDLAHVTRLILVGDPNQLPPIGVGRPFADVVAFLDERSDKQAFALARLNVELRTSKGAPSASLKLASWYTREHQPVDADRVLSDIELGQPLNDLTIRNWKSAGDLREVMQEELVKRFGLSSVPDLQGFNQKVLGLTKEGWVPFDDHNGADRFQILTPVRQHPYGVHDLNRWMQRLYRTDQLKSAKQPWGLSLGDEELVWGDKVIIVRNHKREGWDGTKKQKVEEYLANGEIGILAPPPNKHRFLNAALTGRPHVRFAFSPKSFGQNGGPLELAYALTVHKSQGSEFGVVFAVIPQNTRLLTRELMYTALTRSKDHLVLLIEGDDSSRLYELTLSSRSETMRRNTNMFRPSVRNEAADVPYADHLIHRARNGDMLRSKSELVIANHLFDVGIPYQYERLLEGTAIPGRLRPDFSFQTDAGDILVWEHLGMLSVEEYRRGWEWKRGWYEGNGFVLDRNLFVTQDDAQGGLDTVPIAATAARISSLL